jgi:penicillin-binding protein 1C
VMDELQRHHPDPNAAQPPGVPPGLMQQAVHFEREIEPPRSEWFIPGTEQAEVRLASPMGAARTLIQSPSERSILALDPDIPAPAQKLAFTPVVGVSPQWSWRLDGHRLGPPCPPAGPCGRVGTCWSWSMPASR